MKTFWITEHVGKHTILDTDDVTITISVSQEEDFVRGNALASGDDKVDREEEDRILSLLERGDVWAWACVRVQATAYGITTEDYLGHCSYKSAEAFRKDDYYADMVSIVLSELRKKLIERLEKVSAL